MKKLLIGCGIVALLGLGALGFMTWKLMPVVRRAFEKAEVMGERFLALEQSYPFEASGVLDQQRFASALLGRARLRLRFEAAKEELDAYSAQQKDAGLTDFLEVAIGVADRFLPLADAVPEVLDELRMAPSEFNYHCRVLWATLQLVDAGAADASLEPLRGEFDEFRAAYAEVHRGNEDQFPALDTSIGSFDPPVLADAKTVLARDTQLVLDGMNAPEIEILLLQLQGIIDELEREARRRAEEAASSSR